MTLTRLLILCGILISTTESLAVTVNVEPSKEVAVPTYIFNAIQKNKTFTKTQKKQLLEKMALAQANIRCLLSVKCGDHLCSGAVSETVVTHKSMDPEGIYRRADGERVSLKDDMYIFEPENEGNSTSIDYSDSHKPQSLTRLDFSTYQCTDESELIMKSIQELSDLNLGDRTLKGPKEDCSTSAVTLLGQLNPILQSGFCYASETAMRGCLAFLNSPTRTSDFDSFLKLYASVKSVEGSLLKRSADAQIQEDNMDPIEAVRLDKYLPLNESNCQVDTTLKFLSKLMSEWKARADQLYRVTPSESVKTNFKDLQKIILDFQTRIQQSQLNLNNSNLLNNTILICDTEGTVRALAYTSPLGLRNKPCMNLNFLATSPFNFTDNGERISGVGTGAGREALVAVLKRSLKNPRMSGCVSGFPEPTAKTFYTQFHESNGTPSNPEMRIEPDSLKPAIQMLFKLRKAQSGPRN